ncbi:MAG TPA: hypothetical protein VNH18_00145 [Bryobacteraceae bacterium]|nr:hypothetical protein [Bryobacteraceae bacterium]
MTNDAARITTMDAETARILEERDQLEESFIAGLEPVGEAEMKLALEIARSYWRVTTLSELEEEIRAADSSGVPLEPLPEPLEYLRRRGRELVADEAYRTRVNYELVNAWNALATLQNHRVAGKTPATWIH